LDGLAGPWIAHAKLTVAAMIAWNASTAYADVTPTDGCDATGTLTAVPAGDANEAAC